MKKLISILVAFAMMATLCVCMAFAADSVPAADQADKASATNGKIVKYLVVPDGVKDFPTVESTFTFTGVDGTGTTAAEAQEAVPDPVTITIEGTSTEANPSALSEAEDGLSRVANKPIPAIDLNEIDHPGVYTYTVEETNCAIQNATAATGTLTPDGAKYTVRYTVARNETGTGYVIKYITVTKYDEDTKQTTTITDPTKDMVPETEDVVDNDGGFSFKNTYRLTEGDGTFQKAPLKISKTVNGTPEDLATKTFPIKITLTQAVGAADTVLRAGIYDAEGNLVANSEKDVPYDTETTFDITNGQTVAFLYMPVGTKYVTNEALANAAAYSAYQPSVAVNTDEYTGSEDLGQTLQGQRDNEKLLLEEDDKDLVAYTNKYNPEIDTPTGILISNLPYIALALVAIGGLVAYVVIRRREEDNA